MVRVAPHLSDPSPLNTGALKLSSGANGGEPYTPTPFLCTTPGAWLLTFHQGEALLTMATNAEGDASAQLAAALHQLVRTQQENRFLREQLILQKEKSLGHQELFKLGQTSGRSKGGEGALQLKLDSLIAQSKEMQAIISTTSGELKQRAALIETLRSEVHSLEAKAQQLEAELSAAKPGAPTHGGPAAASRQVAPHAVGQVSDQLHALRMRLLGAEERARLAEGALAASRSAAPGPSLAQASAPSGAGTAGRELEEKAKKLETEVVVLTEALKAATAELKENKEAGRSSRLLT